MDKFQPLTRPITEMDALTLDYWLSKFVQEVAKCSKDPYPLKTLYQIICGIRRFMVERTQPSLNTGKLMSQYILFNTGKLMSQCILLNTGKLMPQCILFNTGKLMPHCILFNTGKLMPQCILLNTGKLMPHCIC